MWFYPWITSIVVNACCCIFITMPLLSKFLECSITLPLGFSIHLFIALLLISYMERKLAKED